MNNVRTRFIANRELWDTIRERIRVTKGVRAAVAYFGRNGAKLLPLKNGDSIVVDMSLGAVRQGVTDPRAVRTLRRRGVAVFSRPSLHAKFVIAGRTLIASSANASRNSNEILDEAGIMTSDPAAVQRANDFFEKLCTEPVGGKYISECIKQYRPPRFKPAAERVPTKHRSHRVPEAKLWFVGGLVSLDLSEKDRASMERLERRAKKKLKNSATTEVRWIRYGERPRFLRAIRLGDWVVDCMKEGKGREVGPPARVLSEEPWVSSRGKKHAVLMLESPKNGESMMLSQFRSPRRLTIRPWNNCWRNSTRRRPFLQAPASLSSSKSGHPDFTELRRSEHTKHTVLRRRTLCRTLCGGAEHATIRLTAGKSALSHDLPDAAQSCRIARSARCPASSIFPGREF